MMAQPSRRRSGHYLAFLHVIRKYYGNRCLIGAAGLLACLGALISSSTSRRRSFACMLISVKRIIAFAQVRAHA